MERLREELDLSGAWWLRQFRPAEGRAERAYDPDFWDRFAWMSANVPGDVHSTLKRYGVIPDPYFGTNCEQCRWVADHEWWYRKTIRVPASLKGKTARLIFDGVDYQAHFWANGEYLGAHRGMFSPVAFDITKLVDSKLTVAVCLEPPPKDRRRAGGTKSQLGYAIDYAPELITVGLWKGVKLVATGECYLEDLFVRTSLEEGGARARLRVEVEATNSTAETREAVLELRLAGESFRWEGLVERLSVRLAPGPQKLTADLELTEPRLWWPWDHGEQNLYRLEAKLIAGDWELDTASRRFGVKQVRMVPNEPAPTVFQPARFQPTPRAEDATPLPWTFEVNGQKVYIRGANWTNVDLLPENLTRERYEHLLPKVRSANLNMLRIHGWHIIEKEEFYDLCDRLGIMVWQEFGFCNTVYPQDDEFLGHVREECLEAVKTIRNHPSLTQLCGGNEFIYPPNQKLAATLQGVAKDAAPDLPFQPTSDLVIWAGLWGDYHHWEVWHRLEPVTYYSNDESLFVSEFGLQAAPNVSSLERFIPKEGLWPPGFMWEYHFAEIDKLYHYARQELGGKEPQSLEEFVAASQQSQAEALKYAIEHYRRRKYTTSGCIFWVFNEPWPSVISGIVDWYLTEKAGYRAVRTAASPVLVSLEYTKRKWAKGEEFTPPVWVVNDYPRGFEGCALKAKLSADGIASQELALSGVEVGPDSARALRRLDWIVPASSTGRFQIELELVASSGECLSRNAYAFWCDG